MQSPAGHCFGHCRTAIVFVYSAAGCQVTPQITSFVQQILILFDEIPALRH